MPTVNELLQHGNVSHQVNFQQLSAGVVRKVIRLLSAVDADLAAQLFVALERVPASTTFTVERIDALLESVRDMNRKAYAAVSTQLELELRNFAGYEAGFQQALVASSLPGSVPFAVAGVSQDQVLAAVLSQPFQGRLLREWMATLEADRARRIRDTVRMGFAEGQTSDQIIRRVRGTRAGRFQDGILEVDRRNAEAVVRTALAHVAEGARAQLYAANDTLIKAVVWHSTLDTRTSSECQIRDGKHYHPVTHKPLGHKIPWRGGPGRLHWRCRSASYPVVKSWAELGLDGDEMTPSERASMDGQVPADLSYGRWLQQQSAARQDEIVGPTRGKLMREGKVPFDSLYTNRGELLTLEQLKVREAAAFRKAGV